MSITIKTIKYFCDMQCSAIRMSKGLAYNCAPPITKILLADDAFAKASFKEFAQLHRQILFEN